MPKKNRMVRHRDSETGRFVSRDTYNRSKARGGTRYKRVLVKKVRRTRVAPEITPPVPAATPSRIAWLIYFQYQPGERGSKAIQADFIVGGEEIPGEGSVEAAQRLLSDTVKDLPVNWRWLGHLAVGGNVDAAKAPNEKAPRKIWIRSFKRGLSTRTWTSEEDFYSTSEGSEE